MVSAKSKEGHLLLLAKELMGSWTWDQEAHWSGAVGPQPLNSTPGLEPEQRQVVRMGGEGWTFRHA